MLLLLAAGLPKKFLSLQPYDIFKVQTFFSPEILWMIHMLL